MRKAHPPRAALGFPRSRANRRLCGLWLPSQMPFSHQRIIFPKDDFMLLLTPGEGCAQTPGQPSITWDGRWTHSSAPGLSAFRGNRAMAAPSWPGQLRRGRGSTQPKRQRGALACRLSAVSPLSSTSCVSSRLFLGVWVWVWERFIAPGPRAPWTCQQPR